MEKNKKRTAYGIGESQMLILDTWKKEKGLTKDKVLNALIVFGKQNEASFFESYVKQQTKHLIKDSEVD